MCMKESRLLEKSDERLDLPILMVACDVAKFGEYSRDYILCLSMVALNNDSEVSINIAVNSWMWSIVARMRFSQASVLHSLSEVSHISSSVEIGVFIAYIRTINPTQTSGEAELQDHPWFKSGSPTDRSIVQGSSLISLKLLLSSRFHNHCRHGWTFWSPPCVSFFSHFSELRSVFLNSN